jgi:TolB-like protein/cytochrome c-type biogenesis protein CcmH/NrfG
MMAIYAFGPFRLDAEAEMLFRGAEPITLGRRAVALLSVLVERAGVPISKDELIEVAWSGLAVEESNLTVQITALRRVLGEEPGGERWIETLPRRGYRFVGPVVARHDDSVAIAPQAFGVASYQSVLAPRSKDSAEQSAPAFTLLNSPSIAVLPFTNMSGDPEQEYFADGMVDEIITGLSRIKWLLVISRNSSFIYKNRPVAVKEVADKLGVRYVLEGGVRKSENHVRITAQLIDAETGGHLWAEQYDRLFQDLFALQDEITMCVIGAIEPSLRKAEVNRVKRRRPDNVNAYDLVLRSLPNAYTRMPQEAAIAIPLLEDALKLEPNYGIAHALLGWCLHARFRRGGMRQEDRTAAIHHAHAAIAHGNDDATALAAAAYVLVLEEHDTTTALKLFDRALDLSNSNIFALSCSAVTLALMGKTELAVERAQLALRLSPFDSVNFWPNHALAISYFHTQRYEDAIDAARTAIESNPRFSVLRAVLTAALTRLGRLEEAKAAARGVLECEPSWTIRGTVDIIGFVPAVISQFADAWREVGLPE